MPVLPLLSPSAVSTRSVTMLSTFPPRPCGLATFADALSAALARAGCRISRVPVDDGRSQQRHAEATVLSARRRRSDETAKALSHGEVAVPHRDPLAIATAVRSVVRDPQRLAEMTAKAIALAPQFSWDAVASKYLKLRDELQPVAARTT